MSSPPLVTINLGSVRNRVLVVGGVVHQDSENVAHGFPQSQLCQNILTRGSSRRVPMECSCGGYLSTPGLSWTAEHRYGARVLMLRGNGCGLDMDRLVSRNHGLSILYRLVISVGGRLLCLDNMVGGSHGLSILYWLVSSVGGWLLCLDNMVSQHCGGGEKLFSLSGYHGVERGDFP